ncbi:hypothetical protein QO010_000370 [Caulobacter ginsengisoli]|uniref:DUF4055 domain-containing protein n=1 Tax=Caulobacter ginsengisoli TaxID=400775 RepID=A0ABU0IKU2_9CAUL|nr:DUF4055 domain-containing protein [Caulobacter ginsengisoli]MDQ0462622.1 hypothetical protein [Caulobacter ginsengisoli]
MPDAVNAPSAAVATMASPWPMLEALMGGTARMRGLGERLLPRWPGEEAEGYRARLATATLFPALRRTVSAMVGKPFAKPLTLGVGTPAQIVNWADDIDLEGVSLHVFAAEMFAEALTYGLAGILVEVPRPVDGAVTQADQAAAGVRPYFVRVMHGQILGWRTAVIGGRRVLSQLRLSECASEADGDFGEASVERVRVLEPGRWAIWERTDPRSEAWVLKEEGLSGLPVVPFVPLYGTRVDFMAGQPPLLDLAYLNVKHWQSQSDQDTILHVARVPILALVGGDKTTALTVGSGTAVSLPVDGDLKFVEHSGAAIAAGQASLDALEQQMIQAGAELLVRKPGQRTAAEALGDAEASKSDLQRLVENFEDSLDQALFLMARYAGLDDGGSVSLFKDFGAASLAAASGQLVLAMKAAGLISAETAVAEMKRRGELAVEAPASTAPTPAHPREGGDPGVFEGEPAG